MCGARRPRRRAWPRTTQDSPTDGEAMNVLGLSCGNANGSPELLLKAALKAAEAERVLRSRVACFISVGGSLPSRWKTLALPLMHTMTFSMHIGVVDQIQFAGAGMPGSVLLDESAAPRAEQLGRNVAQQIGRESEDVEYK